MEKGWSRLLGAFEREPDRAWAGLLSWKPDFTSTAEGRESLPNAEISVILGGKAM
jgi:hypothetical protein